MPTPEQKPVASSAEQIPEKDPQALFEEQVRRLTEPQVEINDKGEEVTKAAVIENEHVLRLARQALSFAGKSPEGLTGLVNKGNELCFSGEITEENGGWAEWAELVMRLVDYRDFLLKGEKGREATPKAMPTEVKLSGLDEFMERMKDLQEETIKSAQKNQEGTENLIKMFIGYNERTREIYSQLPSEEEKERWVDVELQQDFYTRFTPNVEPRFYTRLSSEKRREWDTRWQLARAAFWKKISSAEPEKLAQNPDLIELTTEQMETLYNIEGVKRGLEWYTKAILERTDIYEGWDKETGEPIGQAIKKSLVECKSGREFETFRKNLQYSLKREVFGVTKEEEESLAKRAKEGDEKAEEQMRDLRIKVKSADAVAWNWMWISNLVESIDSRYSGGLGENALRKRHGELAPVICSDDLRSVFHPQEKFEDKCTKGLEWGAFGKWGVLQIGRIKKETGKKAEDFIFKGANSPSRFWRYEYEGKKVLVEVPECYPVATMKSFWETYKEGEKGPSLLSKLQQGQEIDWKQVNADPWKTNYLTVLLNKANKLFEYFNPGKPIELGKFGAVKIWADPLLDILRRLGLEKDEELKSWAVYAATGGVANVSRQTPQLNLPPLDKNMLLRALRDRNVQYFTRTEKFQI